MAGEKRTRTGSFEDNAAQEYQPAPACPMAYHATRPYLTRNPCIAIHKGPCTNDVSSLFGFLTPSPLSEFLV